MKQDRTLLTTSGHELKFAEQKTKRHTASSSLSAAGRGYRFKTEEEFQNTCDQDSQGDFDAGRNCFVPRLMGHLYGQPINEISDLNFKSQLWDDEYMHGETWMISPEMFVPIDNSITNFIPPATSLTPVTASPMPSSLEVSKYNLDFTKAHRAVRVGDFLAVRTLFDDSVFYIVAITQVDAGLLQLISYSTDSINRFNDVKVKWDRPGSRFDNLSDEVINELTEGSDWKLIDVELTIKL